MLTTHANPEMRAAAFKGWGAARQSRAPGAPAEIFEQMGTKGVNPDEKLEETFKTYGHGSVADGSRLEVHISDIPMHVPFTLFNIGYINSGQEKSTRYQKGFGTNNIHPLNQNIDVTQFDPKLIAAIDKEYQALGAQAMENFEWMRKEAEKAYVPFFTPDLTNGKEKGALGSRILDTARYFLPLGLNTGFAYETSARDFSRKIAFLKGHADMYYNKIGEQLETLLSPTSDVEEKIGVLAEARNLVRHTDARPEQKEVLHKIRDQYRVAVASQHNSKHNEQSVDVIVEHPGQFSLAQFISVANPAISFRDAVNYVTNLSNDKQAELSKLVYSAFDNYNEVPAIGRTTGLVTELHTQIGEIRDWNRHKSVGRTVSGIPAMYGMKTDMNMFQETLSKGWGSPAYLRAFPELQSAYDSRNEKYYEDVLQFSEKVKTELGNDQNVSFLNNLLILGHTDSMTLNATPQDVSYIAQLRVRPGGHINYRETAWDIADGVANSHPSLAGLTPRVPRPDYSDREQFFNRS